MGLVYKLDRLYRIGQESAALIYLNVFFDPAQSPKLRFNTNPFGVGLFHDSPGDRDIFFEWFVTRVDHYRTVKSGINTFVAGRFIPVVQMDCKHCVRMDLFGRSNHRLEHAFIRIASSAFRNLNDEWRLRFSTSTKETQNLF